MDKKRREMGIGPAGRPDIIFVRKFRWTLHSESLVEYFFTKASLDFCEKTIKFSCMEAYFQKDTLSIVQWLEKNISDEKLYFTTYDGCGSTLYQYSFTGLTLIGNKLKFNYKDSSLSERKVKLHFVDCKLEYEYVFEPTEIESNIIKPEKKKLKGKIKIKKPIEVNFLNGSTIV